MTLNYRGIQYLSTSALPVATSVAGCYRGVATTVQLSSSLPAQPFFNLKYRGVHYRPSTSPNFGSHMAIAL